VTAKHLVPFFGKYRLDEITSPLIDKRLVSFTVQEEAAEKKKCNAAAANRMFGTLTTMLNWAVKKSL
jgi:hypothetical protein